MQFELLVNYTAIFPSVALIAALRLVVSSIVSFIWPHTAIPLKGFFHTRETAVIEAL